MNSGNLPFHELKTPKSLNFEGIGSHYKRMGRVCYREGGEVGGGVMFGKLRDCCGEWNLEMGISISRENG